MNLSFKSIIYDMAHYLLLILLGKFVQLIILKSLGNVKFDADSILLDFVLRFSDIQMIPITKHIFKF